MAFCNSPLSQVGYPGCLSSIGNKKYTIVIPKNSNIISWYSRDFLTLPIYYNNIECVIDDNKILHKIPNKDMLPCYFLVNDSLFLVNIEDRPINNWEEWVPFQSKSCTAFFIYALRSSTKFIFKNCSIPIFPFPSKCGSFLDHHYMEYSHSLNIEKNIPVFLVDVELVGQFENISDIILSITFLNLILNFWIMEQF